jgi:hypothetical protein
MIPCPGSGAPIGHNLCMPESRKRQPKSRPPRSASPGRTTAAPGKELRPWQLAAFILIGLVVAGAFVGVGFAKRSHDEYGQWPWARTAIPPKMYYEHANYVSAGTGSTTGLVKVGKTPGGGVIFAATADKKTPVPEIDVQKASGGAVIRFTIALKK